MIAQILEAWKTLMGSQCPGEKCHADEKFHFFSEYFGTV
jgi:hypothetical protein